MQKRLKVDMLDNAISQSEKRRIEIQVPDDIPLDRVLGYLVAYWKKDGNKKFIFDFLKPIRDWKEE